MRQHSPLLDGDGDGVERGDGRRVTDVGDGDGVDVGDGLVAEDEEGDDGADEAHRHKGKDDIDSLLDSNPAAPDMGMGMGMAGKMSTSNEWAVDEKLMRPEDIRFDEEVPEKAIEYPFELDPFQKQAIIHLHKVLD